MGYERFCVTKARKAIYSGIQGIIKVPDVSTIYLPNFYDYINFYVGLDTVNPEYPYNPAKNIPLIEAGVSKKPVNGRNIWKCFYNVPWTGHPHNFSNDLHDFGDDRSCFPFMLYALNCTTVVFRMDPFFKVKLQTPNGNPLHAIPKFVFATEFGTITNPTRHGCCIWDCLKVQKNQYFIDWINWTDDLPRWDRPDDPGYASEINGSFGNGIRKQASFNCSMNYHNKDFVGSIFKKNFWNILQRQTSNDRF